MRALVTIMDPEKVDPFLRHRKSQEEAHRAANLGVSDPMASLISVELNITELCNRTCVFCPRTDPAVYPNRKLNMRLDVVERVADDLAGFGFQGRISFSGFGEPFLNRQLETFVRACRSRLPQNTIEINTNGDFLKVEGIRALFRAGLTFLYVNLYDSADQEPALVALLESAGVAKSQYRLRPHWAGATEDFGLNLNNRSGLVNIDNVRSHRTPEDLRGKPCYYPFYKMLVDWDGRVLFCSNDWGRKIVVGDVVQQSIRDIWLSEAMRTVRERLAAGNRQFSPCDGCNVVGTLHGRDSFDRLRAHHGLSV
jgi:radical SAM protein with 4Fe4S-binding SPASM domain